MGSGFGSNALSQMPTIWSSHEDAIGRHGSLRRECPLADVNATQKTSEAKDREVRFRIGCSIADANDSRRPEMMR